MRKGEIYKKEVKNRKVKMIFRDSLKLLPGSLRSLGDSLCPELEAQGDVDHSTVSVDNLRERKLELMNYMKQDIHLLAGIMRKAQAIYLELYGGIYITTRITLSSLAFTLFSNPFFNSVETPIAIPHRTADEFIRRAYYGGHSDVYKPYGGDPYYYYVNSLYPHVMKESPMPIGPAKWHGNLINKPIDGLYGFIECYVKCPESMHKPFLPYREENGVLRYAPTGEFLGISFSEELQYAKEIAYTIHPIRGYLYEKGFGLFNGFITHMYDNRIRARESSNEGLAYVYKILINSLYGRFGIHRRSTVTEICESARYEARSVHS